MSKSIFTADIRKEAKNEGAARPAVKKHQVSEIRPQTYREPEKSFYPEDDFLDPPSPQPEKTYRHESKSYDGYGFDHPETTRREDIYAPERILTQERSMLRFLFMNLITLGIYSIVFYSSVSMDINTIACRHDGRRTMHYIGMIILTFFTFGIAAFVWFHRLSNRILNELRRRGINYYIGADTFWEMYVIGIVFIIGPLVYIHKLCKAMNLLCENYNVYG